MLKSTLVNVTSSERDEMLNALLSRRDYLLRCEQVSVVKGDKDLFRAYSTSRRQTEALLAKIDHVI